MEILINPLSPAYIESASALERKCVETAWSAASILEAAESELYTYAVIIENGEVIACGGIRTSCGEGEITNISVKKECRNRGIGSALLNELCGSLEAVFLEVASKNSAAVSLYTKNGFKKTGVRKGFYKNPPDDALIMCKRL